MGTGHNKYPQNTFSFRNQVSIDSNGLHAWTINDNFLGLIMVKQFLKKLIFANYKLNISAFYIQMSNS